MRIKKQLGKYIIITLFLLLSLKISIHGQERIIVDVEILSEENARINLKYINDQNKDPIRILGWTLLDKKTLKITYEAGPSIPKGWDHRKIEGKDYKFPMKIILEEKGKTSNTLLDLPKNEENRLSILNLFYRGILSGYTDGSLKPQNNVNRAEFAKMLTQTAKYPITNQKNMTNFQDIGNKFWAKPYIDVLADKEIFKGRGNGTFDPSGNISMGEVLAVINRTFTLYNNEKTYPNPLTNHWSNQDFLSMVKAGIVKPTDGFYTRYKPKENATREQCALLLSRVLEQFNETK